MNCITKRLAMVTLALSATVLSAGAAQAAYQLTEITRPGATAMALWDINNAGVMVGYSVAGTAPTDYAQGFVFDGTGFSSLAGPAGALSSNATGISDGGRVVGSFFASAGIDPATGDVILGPNSGFIFEGGVYTVFNVPGAVDTALRGISPNGRYLTGYYGTDTVAGVGFVYDTVSGTLTNLSVANSQFTIPQGVRDDGTVVGGDIISGPPTTRPGFVYDPATGARTDQNVPGAFRTAIRAIADDGFQSGWYYGSDIVQHGFAGSVSGFEQIDFAGADSTYIEGNNNARWLVGGFLVGDTTHAFLATPIPEPGTAALLALGLVVAALALRKRG
jgi:uncharacterized membrane protein